MFINQEVNMFESVKESLAAWNTKYSDRAKLQHAYIAISVLLLVVAGVVGLMNRELGQNILVVSIIGAAMFLANAIAWSLLQSALLFRLPRRSAPTRKK
jgi:NADH:ubiquinone oxidoreductase subunit 6 (subunit J)